MKDQGLRKVSIFFNTPGHVMLNGATLAHARSAGEHLLCRV